LTKWTKSNKKTERWEVSTDNVSIFFQELDYFSESWI